MNKNYRNESGIALISVALFVMVMGILMFSAIYVLKTQSIVKSEQKNIDYTASIKEAIENYVGINGRYPCPAVMNAVPDTPTFGVEARSGTDCNGGGIAPVTAQDGSTNVFIGAVPVRSLSLPEEMIADGNKLRYVYAITGPMAADGADPRYGQGAVTIRSTAGGASLTTPADSAVYALISPGADKRGAFDINGQATSQICPTAADNADTHENCDFDDAIFVAKSDKFAGSSVNDYTASVAFAVNPTAFNWVAQPWQACAPADASMPCFDGEQDRAVDCVNRNGTPGTPADCAHTAAPENNRTCALAPCRWEAACSGGGGGDDSPSDNYDTNGDGRPDTHRSGGDCDPSC